MYWDGGGWAWMAFMPLVRIVPIGLIVWAVICLARPSGGHHSSQGSWQPPRETPEEILDRRFAAGEIDAGIYSEARERLLAHKPGPR